MNPRQSLGVFSLPPISGPAEASLYSPLPTVTTCLTIKQQSAELSQILTQKLQHCFRLTMATSPPNIHLMPNRQLRPPSPASSHLSDRSSRSAHTIRSNSSQPSVEGEARSDAASSSGPSELNIRVKVNRELTWLDVCAFIVNKMIGTGIFTGPPVILSYTGKKSTAIWLWTAGFVYTLLRYILIEIRP